MKHELITLLIGASFFAADVEAWRNRDRDNQTGRDDHVDVPEFVDFDRDGFVDDVFLVQASGNRRVGYGW